MRFNDFDPAAFLRDHWQKTPLLIRNPWAGWSNPLEPDELAGLACEDAVESRLIIGGGDATMVEHGPLAEDRFDQLGPEPWTLLVQSVDHHVPDVAALLEPFRFVPNWRVDDVMVSYATDGGGVGPHFDRYDVFLLQGLGRRRWRIGQSCDEATELKPHADLRLLADFRATDEWVLEPGDILYVPPGVAHDGVAVGDDCMTYSIGFRAPSRGELVAGWCEHLIAEVEDGEFYRDPDLSAPANPGEIPAHAIERLHAMIAERMNDRRAFARWFGRHNSARKNPEIDWSPDAPVDAAELREHLAAGRALSRNPASRFSFVREGADAVTLFVDGEEFPCAAETAERICAADHFQLEAGSREAEAVLLALLNGGAIAFDD